MTSLATIEFSRLPTDNDTSGRSTLPTADQPGKVRLGAGGALLHQRSSAVQSLAKRCRCPGAADGKQAVNADTRRCLPAFLRHRRRYPRYMRIEILFTQPFEATSNGIFHHCQRRLRQKAVRLSGCDDCGADRLAFIFQHSGLRLFLSQAAARWFQRCLRMLIRAGFDRDEPVMEQQTTRSIPSGMQQTS